MAHFLIKKALPGEDVAKRQVWEDADERDDRLKYPLDPDAFKFKFPVLLTRGCLHGQHFRGQSYKAIYDRKLRL